MHVSVQADGTVCLSRDVFKLTVSKGVWDVLNLFDGVRTIAEVRSRARVDLRVNVRNSFVRSSFQNRLLISEEAAREGYSTGTMAERRLAPPDVDHQS